MTDPVKPDDRELEQYLEGGSKLSRRYRDASSESAPPELDEVILARARAELKRKPPSLNRMLAPVALAASVVLGVNLAWNLWQVEPLPKDMREAPAKVQSRDESFVPEPPASAAPAAPAPQPERKAKAAPAPAPRQESLDRLAAAQAKSDSESETDAMRERQAEAESAQKREDQALRKQAEERAETQSFASAPMAGAAAPQARAAMADDAPPLSEPQKIDRLIAYVGALPDAVFIRNGKEYGPAEAAKHLQLKREKAGDRCATAGDFIRVCASFSSTSGEAYLIRLKDGRTRTAEDVLREALAQVEGR